MVFGHSGAMKSRYTMHLGAYLYRKPTTDFTDEANDFNENKTQKRNVTKEEKTTGNIDPKRNQQPFASQQKIQPCSICWLK
jgi:hypothetical protein